MDLQKLGSGLKIRLLVSGLQISGCVQAFCKRKASHNNLPLPLHLLVKLSGHRDRAGAVHLPLIGNNSSHEFLISRCTTWVVEFLRVVLPHPLRVELQPHDELPFLWVVSIRIVEAFNQPIRRKRHWDEPLGQPLYALVVVAIHHELHVLVAVERVDEPQVKRRVLHDPHIVTVAVVVVVVDVHHRRGGPLGQLLVDVLVESAAAGDVEDLRTPADAQEGYVAFEAELGEVELDGVLLPVDGGVAGVKPPDLVHVLGGQVHLRLVERWVDVLPFAEQDAMDGLEALEQHVDAGHPRHDDGRRAIIYYKIKVIFPCFNIPPHEIENITLVSDNIQMHSYHPDTHQKINI